MRELMEAGKVTPVIERRYRLSEVPEAIRYLGQKHARGKLVINSGIEQPSLTTRCPKSKIACAAVYPTCSAVP